jgi:hypothetical protein
MHDCRIERNGTVPSYETFALATSTGLRLQPTLLIPKTLYPHVNICILLYHFVQLVSHTSHRPSNLPKVMLVMR